MTPLGKGPTPEEKGSGLVRNALDTIDAPMRARLWFSVIQVLLALNLSLTFHNIWPT